MLTMLPPHSDSKFNLRRFSDDQRFYRVHTRPGHPHHAIYPCLPIVWRQEKEKTRKKGKKSRKLKAANKRAEASVWQAGYLARENEMLRQMILLATAAERSKLNSGISEVGLRLIAK